MGNKSCAISSESRFNSSESYVTAEELLTENLHLHEELHLAKDEIDRLKNLLEIAQVENAKAFKAYFQVSEKLRMYEYRDKEKVPFLKRFINDD